MTRMVPTRYLTPAKPVRVKPPATKLAHFTPPLKGLSLATNMTPGDPQTAVVLRNFVIEDDRIQVRAGTLKMSTHADAKTIEWLIPWYGGLPKALAATNHKLADVFTGNDIKTGFTSDDWDWTSFANLSQQKFTVMVNGADGVWSWNGALAVGMDPPAVTVTSLSNTNPARCTVAAGDLAKFQNGMVVTIAGATGTGMTVANGAHTISDVDNPTGTFTLVGVDTSGGAAPQTTGVTADPPGLAPIAKETVVAAPADAAWVVTDQFQLVLAHMNRLFFADSTNLAFYYLPLQQKSGTVKSFQLNALFRRGGSIRAMYTWTLEGGTSANDMMVIFSTNGEAAIFQGTDPDSDWDLVGVFRFDAPMSKHSVVNYGGELYVLISTGLVPMSTMMKAESDQLGQQDRNVVSIFREQSTKYRDRRGWQAILNPSSGRLVCNMPDGASNLYRQLVRHMPLPRWSEWGDLRAHCWLWLDPYLYLGDDSGNVYRMHPDYLNDDGQPIRADVQMAWSTFKTVAIKQFKMIQPYFITDGDPHPFVDVRVDYNLSPLTNRPDVTLGQPGATWDVSDWATDTVAGEYWATGEETPVHFWQGVASIGRVGAPCTTVLVKDCHFSIAGWDVLYETGAAVA